MKIIAVQAPVDEHGCRLVAFTIEYEDIEGGYGAMETRPAAYSAGALYLKEGHVEMILRSLGGHSFGYQGELEVRTAALDIVRGVVDIVSTKFVKTGSAIEAMLPPDPSSKPQWGVPDWQLWARSARAAILNPESQTEEA